MKLNGFPTKTVVDFYDLRLYLCKVINNSPYAQRDLAKMANVSQGSISSYVRGKIDSPSLEWIVRIFKALNIPMTVLLDFIY